MLLEIFSQIKDLLLIIIPATTLYFSYKCYKLMTAKKIFAFSQLIPGEKEPLIKVTVRNTGYRPLSVHSVRINLMTYNYQPRYRRSTRLGRLMSKWSMVTNEELLYEYPSEQAFVGEKIDFPKSLNMDEQFSCTISVSKMFDYVHSVNEAYGKKIFFWFLVKKAKVQVLLSDKIVNFSLDADSKDYIWKSHKDDERLFY